MTLNDSDLNELPEWKKKLIKSKYGGESFLHGQPTFADLADIDQRLRELESRVFKYDKTKLTTRSQQMLLMKDLGFLDIIRNLNISQKKQANLLSVLLNASADNIKDDLTYMNQKDYTMYNKENLTLALKTYTDAGLKELAEKTTKSLDETHRSKK